MSQSRSIERPRNKTEPYRLSTWHVTGYPYSERQTHPHLYPTRTGGRRDGSKCPAIDVRIRVPEERSVRKVVELGPVLEPQAFPNGEPAKYREIVVLQARSMNDSDTGVPELVGRGRH